MHGLRARAQQATDGRLDVLNGEHPPVPQEPARHHDNAKSATAAVLPIASTLVMCMHAKH